MRLPMLAEPGPLPTGHGWAFEPKWDEVDAIADELWTIYREIPVVGSRTATWRGRGPSWRWLAETRSAERNQRVPTL